MHVQLHKQESIEKRRAANSKGTKAATQAMDLQKGQPKTSRHNVDAAHGGAVDSA
jgi:hypothetical protein